ncbi:MAG: hypothetical protein MJ147_00605 [Clostridia bacterium]|nr:hypothetical protein [Clostridia bacterium]
MCDTLKKVLKIVGIIAAIAGVAVAVYALVKKFCPACGCKCDKAVEDDKCDYVSCSCFEGKEEEAAE